MIRVPLMAFPERATIEIYRGATPRGWAYDPPLTDIPIQIDYRSKTVQGTNGELIQLAATALLMYDRTDVTPESKITVDGREYRVYDVHPVKWRSTVTHVEVLLI